MIEADLLEEPQYLYLKATRLVNVFIKELPLVEDEAESIINVNNSSGEVQSSDRCQFCQRWNFGTNLSANAPKFQLMLDIFQ